METKIIKALAEIISRKYNVEVKFKYGLHEGNVVNIQKKM